MKSLIQGSTFLYIALFSASCLFSSVRADAAAPSSPRPTLGPEAKGHYQRIKNLPQEEKLKNIKELKKTIPRQFNYAGEFFERLSNRISEHQRVVNEQRTKRHKNAVAAAKTKKHQEGAPDRPSVKTAKNANPSGHRRRPRVRNTGTVNANNATPSSSENPISILQNPGEFSGVPKMPPFAGDLSSSVPPTLATIRADLANSYYTDEQIKDIEDAKDTGQKIRDFSHYLEHGLMDDVRSYMAVAIKPCDPYTMLRCVPPTSSPTPLQSSTTATPAASTAPGPTSSGQAAAATK